MKEETGSGIRVAVRIRPLNRSESDHRETQVCEILDDCKSLCISAGGKDTSTYCFDAVFGPKTTQESVFNECGVKHLIDSALGGYACTAFAFGQTGSGKTHTVTGPDASDDGAGADSSDEGLIQRSIRYLYSQAAKTSTNRNTISLSFSASYIEIYNEQVIDLLNNNSRRGPLPVRWKADRGFYVDNLFILECQNEEDMLDVLEEGLRTRKTASHEMNDRSSRSHTILTLYCEIKNSSDDDPVSLHGSIAFVDLAGSERVKSTKADSQTLAEAQSINKSLLTLGNCISALGDPKKRKGHIPYRESALTMLLKDGLGGTGMTLMIACIAPAGSAAQESSKTLRYASRATRIRNKPTVHRAATEKLVQALQREVQALKKEVVFYQQSGNSSIDLGVTAVPGFSKGDLQEIAPMAKELLEMRAMVQQYMKENEELRAENISICAQQEQIVRLHEEVVRDNEKLLRVVRDIDEKSPRKRGGKSQARERLEQLDVSGRLVPGILRQITLESQTTSSSIDRSDAVIQRDLMTGALADAMRAASISSLADDENTDSDEGNAASPSTSDRGRIPSTHKADSKSEESIKVKAKKNPVTRKRKPAPTGYGARFGLRNLETEMSKKQMTPPPSPLRHLAASNTQNSATYIDSSDHLRSNNGEETSGYGRRIDRSHAHVSARPLKRGDDSSRTSKQKAKGSSGLTRLSRTGNPAVVGGTRRGDKNKISEVVRPDRELLARVDREIEVMTARAETPPLQRNAVLKLNLDDIDAEIEAATRELQKKRAPKRRN